MGTERVERAMSPDAPSTVARTRPAPSAPSAVLGPGPPAPTTGSASWSGEGRIRRSTELGRPPAANPQPTRIRRAVSGGKKGDAAEHVESKEQFTIVDLEDDEFGDRLYHMVPVKGGERFRVYGDIRTYRLLPGAEPTPPGREIEAAPREAPLRMSLPPPNVRPAAWGSVTEVLPGIGVELVGDNPGYVAYVQAQLTTILETRAGAELLAQFDPRRPGGRPVRTDPPYEGISVVVAPPPALAPKGKTVHPAILTSDVGPRKSATARDFNLPMLPRIQFHDIAKGDQTVGDNEGQLTDARFEPGRGGYTHHKDFPTSVVSFDLALYHEFLHAFLSHVGIAGRLREGDLVRKLRIPNEADTAEEELVVGILAGKGLPMSENAYRCERGMELRGTYRAVKITGDPDLGRAPWSPSTPPKEMVDAVRGLGAFSAEEAGYIVTGRR